MKKRIARIATLLCFFHFSGLNNGYSYSMVASVNVKQSVSLVNLATGGCYSHLSPSRVASALNHGRRFVVLLSLCIRPVVENYLVPSSKKIAAMSSNPLAPLARWVNPGGRTQALDIPRSLSEAWVAGSGGRNNRVVMAHQRNYLKENKETWTRFRNRNTNSPLLHLSGPWKGAAVLSRWNLSAAGRPVSRGREIVIRNLRLILGAQDRSADDLIYSLLMPSDRDPSLNTTGFLLPRHFDNTPGRRTA